MVRVGAGAIPRAVPDVVDIVLPVAAALTVAAALAVAAALVFEGDVAAAPAAEFVLVLAFVDGLLNTIVLETAQFSWALQLQVPMPLISH